MVVIAVCGFCLFLFLHCFYLILSADLTSFSSDHIALYDMKYMAMENIGAPAANSISNVIFPPPSTWLNTAKTMYQPISISMLNTQRRA